MFLNFLFTNTPLFYFVQSFWRDEAYSVLLAQQPVLSIISKSYIEPPLYYVILHFWIKLFGSGEIATRSFSLLGFTLATLVAIEWADKLFKSHWLSKFMPVFFFFNPMLLYYAFEVRAYGWYIFFAILSFFAYDQKRWRLYQGAVLLGIYTHLYFVIIPFVHAIFYVFQKKLWRGMKKPVALLKDPMIRSLTVIGIGFLPWMLRLLIQISKFKDAWYFPVDIRLILSVVGNIFIGYEGTPWYMWGWTQILSIILCVLFGIALIPKNNRVKTVPLFLMIFIPLIVILTISFVKPIFVNRYLIPVTIAQVILLCFSVKAVPYVIGQKILAGIVLIFVVVFNCWYPQQHAKQDVRKIFQEVNSIKSPGDLIVASDALMFMETLYYAKDKQSVRLYNPMNNPFPWYIGEAAFSPNLQISSLPLYPTRAFFIQNDATFTIRYNLPDTQKVSR